jgi:hypothetical protein
VNIYQRLNSLEGKRVTLNGRFSGVLVIDWRDGAFGQEVESYELHHLGRVIFVSPLFRLDAVEVLQHEVPDRHPVA